VPLMAVVASSGMAHDRWDRKVQIPGNDLAVKDAQPKTQYFKGH
jgi:hypothetical protein